MWSPLGTHSLGIDPRSYGSALAFRMSKLRQDGRTAQNAGVYWLAQGNQRQGAAEAAMAASVPEGLL